VTQLMKKLHILGSQHSLYIQLISIMN